MNDNDRELWVMNDEKLYNWWKASRLPKRVFIEENRNEIDNYIDKQIH